MRVIIFLFWASLQSLQDYMHCAESIKFDIETRILFIFKMQAWPSSALIFNRINPIVKYRSFWLYTYSKCAWQVLNLLPSIWSEEEKIVGSPLPTACSTWAAVQNKCCQALKKALHAVLQWRQLSSHWVCITFLHTWPKHAFPATSFLEPLFQRCSECLRVLINRVTRAWMRQ